MVEEVWHPVLVAQGQDAYFISRETREEGRGLGFWVRMLGSDSIEADRGQLEVSAVEFELLGGDWFPTGREQAQPLGRITLAGAWIAERC